MTNPLRPDDVVKMQPWENDPVAELPNTASNNSLSRPASSGAYDPLNPGKTLIKLGIKPGTSEQDVRRILGEQMKQSTRDRKRAQRRLDALNGILMGANTTSRFINSFTLGASDRVAALALEGKDFVMGDSDKQLKDLATGEPVENRYEQLKAMNRELKKRFPKSTMTGEISGSVVGAGKIAKAGGTALKFVPQGLSKGKKLAATTGALAVDGAAIEGTRAFIEGRDVLDSGGKGAGFGAAANVVTRGASRALTPLFSKVTQTTTAQQLSRLHEAASKRVERMGAKYSAPAMGYLKRALDEDLIKDIGIDLNKKNQPITYRIVKVIRNAKGEMDFKTLREHANRAKRIAARPEGGEDAYAASILARNIDEFIESAPPTSSANVSGESLAAALEDLSSLTRRVRGSETIEAATKSAKLQTGSLGSKSSLDTTTRQNILQVLEDPKRIGEFTAAEREAMEKVIMGADGQSLLRWFGNFAPSGNAKSLLKAATGKYLAGPEATAALLTSGAISKKISERLTTGHVDELLHLIRNGVPKTSSPNAVGKFISEEEHVQNAARAAMVAPQDRVQRP